MDIVELKHPMLVIETFELLPSYNSGRFVPHAMGYMMDTKEPAYVTFPQREFNKTTWVDELVACTKAYPEKARTLLKKGLGEVIAERVIALHNI